MPRTLRLTVAYDGSAFAGWQLQSGQRTVQGVLEEALYPFEGQRVVVHASGRTDAGVHAAGQVVSFMLASTIEPETLQRALNARLPDDVRVMAAEVAPDRFNARFDAWRKTYRYTVLNGAVVPPHLRHYVWHIAPPLDVDAMNRAAAALVGEHDFVAFQAAGGEVTSTRRSIVISAVSSAPLPDVHQASLVTYEVTGSGFLRHMVRNIVGLLADVGLQRRPITDLAEVLASRDRSHGSPTAPPQGLTLWQVAYK